MNKSKKHKGTPSQRKYWRDQKREQRKKKGKKHSVSYKHTGIDISASVGKSVVVNEHLKFVYKKEFSDGWRWGV